MDRYAADLAAYGARTTHELVPKPETTGPERRGAGRRAAAVARPAPPSSAEDMSIGGIVAACGR